MTADLLARDGLPERERLTDDFIQLRFSLAAAEGEAAGEVLPIRLAQAVEFPRDEGFQRGAFCHSARIFQKLRGGLGQLLFLNGGELFCCFIEQHHFRKNFFGMTSF